MTIIATTKIQFDHKIESAIPSKVDDGEIVFATDTLRLVLGPSSIHGNQNSERTWFPNKNIEILTEFSTTKNKEIFGTSIRNQDDRSLYLSSEIESGVGPKPIGLKSYNGGYANQLFLRGESISAKIEYHAFTDKNNLIASGTLRILASSSGIYALDVSPSSNLTFDVISTIGGYIVKASNTGSNPVFLKISKTVVAV